MGLFAKVFGSSENISKAIDGGLELADKAFFTKEEKAEFNLKLSDMYLEYQKVTAPQNLARRYIAMVVVGIWSLCVFTATLGFVLDASWVMDFLEFCFKVVIPPFMLVMYFYFQKRIKE